jgi:DNA/RNA-binding domain of Phe-tRNA-synthetase-like protein
LNYTIEGILDKYPKVNIGVLVGRGLKISKANLELARYKSDSLKKALEKLGDAPVSQHPYIASWREVYRSFGTKPADYHSSVEALARRVVKTQQLPMINTAVDAYNAVSLRYMMPMGGFDTDNVEDDIELRLSPGDEAFTGLGMTEKEYTYTGEAVYADSKRVLTRRWNYRDCVETMITENTVNLVMFIDGSPEIPRDAVSEALGELKTRLEQYCGGSYSTNIADSQTPIIRII